MTRLRQSTTVDRSPQERKRRDLAMDFMLRIALVAISLLFAGLSLVYVFGKRLSEEWPLFDLPKIFWLSTALVMGCSLAIRQARRAYRSDDGKMIRTGLLLATLMGVGFLISQVVAWRQLAASGIVLSGSPSGSFLYLLSWLHAAHIAVGLVFLTWSWDTARRHTSEPVSALLYFSDPVRKRRLQRTALYWHVVDAIWVYLFAFFLFMHQG